MVDRFYGYQYETSPRKLQPEYKPYRDRYPDKKSTNVTPKKVTEKKEPNIKKKEDTKQGSKHKKMSKSRAKLVVYVLVGFSILFTMSYRNSLINESFNKKESLKSELSSLQKTNEQLKVSIENSLNLNSVEQAAKEKVGMQKLTNNQKIYVSLDKKDYVESASEQIVIDDNKSVIEKIINGFTESIN